MDTERTPPTSFAEYFADEHWVTLIDRSATTRLVQNEKIRYSRNLHPICLSVPHIVSVEGPSLTNDTVCDSCTHKTKSRPFRYTVHLVNGFSYVLASGLPWHDLMQHMTLSLDFDDTSHTSSSFSADSTDGSSASPKINLPQEEKCSEANTPNTSSPEGS